jgi:hypothetical protein
MSRRDRDRRPARRRPFREPKPIILIVCEGTRTEPEYFKGFVKDHQNPRVRIEVAHTSGVPLTLVKHAREKKAQAEDDARRENDKNLAYDAVWCVFDIDEHPAIPRATDMARSNGIQLAISNPCFELWLLLHFRDEPGMSHRDLVVKMLSQHVPDYDKGVNYADYKDGYPQAVIRARRQNQRLIDASSPGGNPSTNVHELTESIRA